MYSQSGEDVIVLEIYKNLKKKYPNKLSNNILDIGANDGVTISNTRSLIMEYNEIVGYFVEPNPLCFLRLKELYGNSHNLYNFAIGDVDSKMEMYCNESHLSDNDNGLLSTILLEETKRWQNEKWYTVNVDVVKYPFTGIDFDFISIDAEGMDKIILTQIDLSKTWILCIEWNSNIDIKKSINEYCCKFSLDLFYENTTNLIYKKDPY